MELPRHRHDILRLLDGVQVDTALFDFHTGKHWWLASYGPVRAAHTLASYGTPTTRASRSNWPATAFRMMVASPRIYLVCPTRPRSTPGAIILDRGASEERPILAVYVGGDRNGTFSYLRPKIAALCDASDACESSAPHDGHRVCGVRCVPGLRRTMMRATFCLQPGGDSPYRKSVFDAALAGAFRSCSLSSSPARVAPWQRGNFPEHFVVLNGAAVQRGEIDVMQASLEFPRRKSPSCDGTSRASRRCCSILSMIPSERCLSRHAPGALAVATGRERVRDGHTAAMRV